MSRAFISNQESMTKDCYDLVSHVPRVQIAINPSSPAIPFCAVLRLWKLALLFCASLFFRLLLKCSLFFLFCFPAAKVMFFFWYHQIKSKKSLRSICAGSIINHNDIFLHSSLPILHSLLSLPPYGGGSGWGCFPSLEGRAGVGLWGVRGRL